MAIFALADRYGSHRIGPCAGRVGRRAVLLMRPLPSLGARPRPRALWRRSQVRSAGKCDHESVEGLETEGMTSIVLRRFSRHHFSSSPLMSRAMAEAQSCDPSVWQARAAQARRIASMLLGPDAELALAYARECDEQGRGAPAKAVSSRFLVRTAPTRVALLMSDRSETRRRAA